MTSSYLPTYYNNLLSDFNQFLGKCKKDPGLEDIHQLRVSIKNIRSAMLFADNISNKRYHFSEQTEQLNQLFKLAGKVREIQLCMQYPISLKAKHAELFKSFLENEIQYYLTKFKDSLEHSDFDFFTAKNEETIELLGTFTNESVQSHANLHIMQQQNILQNLINKKGSEKNLHAIRKELKILIEGINFLNSFHDDDVSNLSTDELDLLYKKIGKWHDLTIHTMYFKLFIKTIQGKDRKIFQYEKRRLEKAILRKRRKIIRMIKTTK